MACFFILGGSGVVYSQNNALVLNGAYIILNGGTVTNNISLVIGQPNSLGIFRLPAGEHIHSENQYNYIKWLSAAGTGNYLFPFGVAGNSANYIPFTFNKTAGNSNLMMSTWATNVQNLLKPAATNVGAVTNMLGTADSVFYAIDRFWDIQTSAATTANLTFSYLGAENTTLAPTSLVMAQHWNGTSWDAQVGPGTAGVSVGVGSAGPYVGQTTFSPWVLTIFCNATITAAGPYCVNSAAVNLTAVQTGGTWSGPGITNAALGTFNPATAGAGSHLIEYGLACGDTDKTTIIVYPLATGTDVQTACGSYTWIDGITYNSSTNTPTFNIVGGSVSGCDSLVTLNLSINSSVTGTDVQTACGSYTWIDGITYNSSTNTPTFNIVGGAASGCDSLVTLNLSINSSVTGTDVQTACGSYTWIDGITYNSSTNTPTFNIVGGSVSGCDSLVTLNLTINSCTLPTASFTTSTNTICAGGSITFVDNSIGAGINSWTWTFDGGTPATANTQGAHTVVFSVTGTFNITLQVGDAINTDDTTIVVTVNNCPPQSGCCSPVNIWASQIGSVGGELSKGVTLDAAGNVYSTGYFAGTVDFDPGVGTLNLISAGSNDVFIQKLDVTGNLVFAKQMGSTASDNGNDITLDAAGNIYVTGDFRGTVDFDPGAGVSNLTALGAGDIFIQKLDAAGNFVWARQMGGTDFESANAIVIDNSGNVYTTGRFEGIVDFDPGAGVSNLTSLGSRDVFISKLDASGNFVWVKQMGGTSFEEGFSLDIDPSGNLYTTGVFRDIIDFDPGAGVFNLTSTGNDDIFIQKLDATGAFVWAKQIGGSSGGDEGRSLTIDATGVYVTGKFFGTVDFDPGVGILNLNSLGGDDVFVLKLDVVGNFVWVKQMGGASSDAARGIALDTSGNIYTTGFFMGTADFDPGVGISNMISVGAEDVFISKLDINGDFLCTTQIGGSGLDIGTSIILDASGDVHTVGAFNATSDFDPSAGTANLTSIGSSDGFTSKINFCTPTALTASFTTSTNTVCEGGNITFTDNSIGAGINSWTWTFNGGVSATASTQGPHTIGFSTSGTHNIILQVGNGTDTDDTTIVITVKPTSTGTDVQTACGSYIWIDGVTYNSSTNTPTFNIVGGAASGCDSLVTLNLTITPPSNATINPSGPFCTTTTAQILTAVDAGGVWSGTGITNTSNGTFDPNVAGAGTHQIIYTISGTCGDADTVNITVNNCLPPPPTGCCNFVQNANNNGITGETFGVKLGDLDGDGDLDAVTIDAYDAIEVWFNNGSGIFAAGTTYSIGSDFYGVELEDVDNDGDLDIIAISFYVAQATEIWKNDGTGIFSLFQSISNNIGSENSRLADLDGDGDLDIFHTNWMGSDQKIYLRWVL